MAKTIQFEGQNFDFPDDATDEEIFSFLNSQNQAAPQQQQAPVAPQAPQQPPQQPDQRWGWQKFVDDKLGMQTLKDATQGVGQGLTLGFGDEVFAAGLTPVVMAKRAIRGDDAGKGFSERVSNAYSAALANERNQNKEAYERSPIANTIGEITGGVMTAGKLANGGVTLLNAAKPTVGNMAARGLGEGAAYGLVTGFGRGEGVDDRIKQSLTSGVTGAVTGAATGGIAGWLAQRAARGTVPSANALRQESEKLFQFADDAGLVLKPDKYSAAVDDIFSSVSNKGFHPNMHGDANTALKALQKLKGQPITLQSIKTMRELTGDVAMSQRPKERLLGRMMRDKLDDLVAGIKDTDVIVKNPNIKVDDAIAAIPKARELWAQMRRSETITDALTRAERAANKSGSGGNIDNAIRQKISSILDNPKRVAGFSDAEKRAMQDIVDGTKTQNALRLIGKLSPQGNGLMAALGMGAFLHNPATAVVPATAYVAKKVADGATRSNVNVLDALIRSGGNMPSTKAISPAQRMIIDSLLANQHMVANRQQVPVK
jgi:hypothetical protein